MATTKKLFSLFCFSSFVFLFFAMNQAIPLSDHMETFCIKSSGNFSRNSTYHTNLNTLLSNLSNQSSLANYYNLTIGLASNTVYGSFLCNVNKTLCNTCVKTATIEIVKKCSNHREAIIYYFDCMVCFSDKFFLSTLETEPSTLRWSTDPIPKSFGRTFGQRLSDKMGKLIIRSPLLSSSIPPYYLMDVTGFDGLYYLVSLAQCSPDLDPGNCTACLQLASRRIMECCSHQFWAMVFTPKCLVSFDLNSTSLPPTSSDSFSIRGNHKIHGGIVLVVAAAVFASLGLR